MRSPPRPPDLTPISNAQIELGRQANEIAREQMGLSRDQFDFFRTMSLEELGFAREQASQMLSMQGRAMDISERGAASMERMSGAQAALMDQAREYGARDRARWESTFIPLQDRFIRQAQEYDTPERREMEAGRAVSEITAQADQQRRNADARLSSMGLDPSQFRSASIAATLGAQTAAAGAQAANNTRRAVEDKGRALIADSIGLGMGLPAQATTSIGVASGAGANAANAAQGATGAGLQGINTAAGLGSGAAALRSGALNNMGSLTGSPMQWAQLGGGSMGMAGNAFTNAGAAMTQGFANSMSNYNASNQRVGNLLGMASMVAGFAEGGRVKRYAEGSPGGVSRDDFEIAPIERMRMEYEPTGMKPVSGRKMATAALSGPSPEKLRSDKMGARFGATMRDVGGRLGRAGAMMSSGATDVPIERYLTAVQMAEGGAARRGMAIPRKQARDVVPAMLSEGEYVIPSDVVDVLGINYFDKLVAKHHRPGA